MVVSSKAAIITKNHKLYDFKNFLWATWNHLNLPNPTPVQYDIADYLQHGKQRMVIEAFRGVGKSWITSAYVCHQLLLKPQLNILVVSASKTRSDDFSTFTLRIIHEMPLLHHLIPRDGQRMSKISFDVAPAQAAHAPSVKSVGVTGQLTGSRADIIIADDVESANNSQTQVMRDKLSETVKEFEAIIKPGGRIIFLGTPQTEMSIYNTLEERGYITTIWPARYPSKPVAYANRLSPIIHLDEPEETPESASLVGKSTDPLRFTDEDLLERELSYGKSGFALQFMIDTTLSDGNKFPLKLNDLMVMSGPSTWDEAPIKVLWASGKDQIDLCRDTPNVGLKADFWCGPMMVSKEYKKWDGSVMSIDPSGRGEDETAYTVVKMLNGILYLTAMGGIQNGYSPESLKTLATVAKEQSVNQIVIESNFGDGMFTQLLKPVVSRIYPCSMEEVRHNTQKEKRIIDTLEPVMNQHRLIISADIIEQDFKTTELHKQLFYQMTRMTNLRGALNHDDRLDSLAIAVNYWTETMDRDIEAAEADHKNDMLNDELQKFMDNSLNSVITTGQAHKVDTW
tara:strand:- start:94 stop:1797 length:1704 start_codon:yes stop_codon:yes gene_type:complete